MVYLARDLAAFGALTSFWATFAVWGDVLVRLGG